MKLKELTKSETLPYDSFERLTSEDTNSINDLYVLLNNDSVTPHVAWQPESPLDVVNELETRDDNYRFVAKTDGHVTGTIVVVPAGGEFTKFSLEGLAVDPKYQSRGIASRMIDDAIEQGKIIAHEKFNNTTLKFEAAVIMGVDNWLVPLGILLKRGFSFRTLLPDQMKRNGKLLNVVGLHLLQDQIDRRPNKDEIAENLMQIVSIGKILHEDDDELMEEIKEIELYCYNLLTN